MTAHEMLEEMKSCIANGFYFEINEADTKTLLEYVENLRARLASAKCEIAQLQTAPGSGE